MKKIIYGCFVFLIFSCKTPQKGIQGVATNKIIPLSIVFSIDKDTYLYRFKLLNNSHDTIQIVKPQLYYGYSHFSKIAVDSMITTERCVTASLNKIEWVELIPKKEIIVNGNIGLRDYFCKLNENDLIGFQYNGAFKRIDGQEGIFCFDIPPTVVGKIDSIVISKILF